MPPSDQTFTFTFEPEMKHLTLAFEGWAAEVKDWRRAWTDVRKLFRNHERQHLDSEGTTTGDRFATLQGKTYPGWKSRHYPGLPILQRDKVLYNALVEGGPGSLFKRNRKSMEIGIKKGYIAPDRSQPTTGKKRRGRPLYTYAKAHQDGKGNAYAGDNKEPRPPVRFGRDASNKSEFAYALGQIMQAHIVLARRRVFKPEIERSFGKKHAESEAGARATIKKMVNGTWR